MGGLLSELYTSAQPQLFIDLRRRHRNPSKNVTAYTRKRAGGDRGSLFLRKRFLGHSV